eukprot:maker-scaffold_62-snap-gene-0.2-mRNA-1 protein AED:0.04 eAED:0.04 QI:112/0/0.5/1/0/0/2/0/396
MSFIYSALRIDKINVPSIMNYHRVKTKQGEVVPQVYNLRYYTTLQFGKVFWYDRRFLNWHEHLAVKRLKTSKYWWFRDKLTGERNRIKPSDMKQEIFMLEKFQSHKYVVGFYGHVSNVLYTYLYLEFCPVSLSNIRRYADLPFDRIQDKWKFPFKMVKHLIYPILDALSYVHEEGYIHADVKPSNILVNIYGVPKLADFGITIKCGTETKHNKMLGTYSYAAPEILYKQSFDYKIDSYSVWVTIMEQITSQSFFSADEVLHEVRRDSSNTGKKLTDSRMYRFGSNYPWGDPEKKEMLSFTRSFFNASPKDRPTVRELKCMDWFKQVKSDWDRVSAGEPPQSPEYFNLFKDVVQHYVKYGRKMLLGRQPNVWVNPLQNKILPWDMPALTQEEEDFSY